MVAASGRSSAQVVVVELHRRSVIKWFQKMPVKRESRSEMMSFGTPAKRIQWRRNSSEASGGASGAVTLVVVGMTYISAPSRKVP
ncbi:hypothetical protein NDN08_006441 [Rhodosorus marinus]|uniref:Uncharacterized protein n=1 Tax=Rhodosorus marinus TaxID=101924 RepID=A0AAV8ULP4_9RHOD|nr:hypothetical protein NDN08_006441 [Rhodosorus marinus]